MFFREHVSGILGVTIGCNLICASLVPLFAVIALQMSRIGKSSAAFTYAYIICVGIGTTTFVVADYCWAVAAVRTDRDPKQINLLNELAWAFFTGTVGANNLKNTCLATSGHLVRKNVQ